LTNKNKNMKKLIIYICLLLPLVGFQSCKKAYSPGDNYDFSNPLPPYVAFKSTAAVSVKLKADHTTAGSATFGFLTRTALQQAITVTYTITGGALAAANQTVVIPRDAVTSANVVIAVPANTAPGTSTVTLNKAVAADGTVLTIGPDNVAANQTLKIVVTQL